MVMLPEEATSELLRTLEQDAERAAKYVGHLKQELAAWEPYLKQLQKQIQALMRNNTQRD